MQFCFFASVAVLGALVWVAGNLQVFLAPNEPLRRGILVVEGWVSADTLASAVEIYQHGDYVKLVATGGPIPETWARFVEFDSYADLAVHLLVDLGLSPKETVPVGSVAAPTGRTYANAVAVRKWLQESELGIVTLDIVSEGFHGRRSWYVYRRALPSDFEVGIISARPLGYEVRAWWTTSAGAKTAIGELLGLVYAVCCLDEREIEALSSC